MTVYEYFGGGAYQGNPLQLISPSEALPGRSEPMSGIQGLRHYVLNTEIAPTELPPNHQVVVLANGCFWGSEKGYWRLPRQGLQEETQYTTAVGYCAGYTANPTYEEVCSGQTGHTEAVRVVYHPEEISLVDLLRWFWESHDPTQVMGQGNDRGTQYRSGLYYFNDEQRQLMESSREAYALRLQQERGLPKIATEIRNAQDYEAYGGLWNYAEAYHQQYLAKPDSRPYCSAQPQGVSLPDYDEWCPFPPGSDLRERHRPLLPDSFWKRHGPRVGCSVVQESNEPISDSS